MKSPLHYQISDYDCGPTSMLNAISFLFEREDVPPEIIRNIMLYCLDCYSLEGIPGKSGTSCAAMMFLSNWLEGIGEIGLLPISCRYLNGQCVCMGRESLVNDALHRGGAVVVRVFYDEWHYVLLTGERNGTVLLFDPYYREEAFPQPDIQLTAEHPFQYNRMVPAAYMNRDEESLYAFGPAGTREAILLFNKETELTANKTIEYFI